MMVAAIVLAAMIASQEGGFGWSTYVPISFNEAWSNAAVVTGRDYFIETASQKWRVEVEYTGRRREVSHARQELLRLWAKTLGHPSDTDALFQHEIEVRAATLTAWLPLQEVLVDSLLKEAAPGAGLRLWVMYVGAAGSDRVFIVNEFEALKKQSAAQLAAAPDGRRQ
jgi:hypothetical protein